MTCIKLKNSVYEVRVVNNTREVMAGGKWLEASYFIDWLCDNDRLDEVMDLVDLGINKIKEILK